MASTNSFHRSINKIHTRSAYHTRDEYTKFDAESFQNENIINFLYTIDYFGRSAICIVRGSIYTNLLKNKKKINNFSPKYKSIFFMKIDLKEILMVYDQKIWIILLEN